MAFVSLCDITCRNGGFKAVIIDKEVHITIWIHFFIGDTEGNNKWLGCCPGNKRELCHCPGTAVDATFLN